MHPREGIDVAALEKCFEELPIKACWLMSRFQNPTGATMSEAKKRHIMALLERYQIPLIEGDVYAELYFDAVAPAPIKAYDTQGLVLHCSSFSKYLAPGYRIGWVASGRYSNKIRKLKLINTISPSFPAQVALADYLLRGGVDRQLKQLRQRLAARQQAMLLAIKRYFPAQVRVTRPQGGYFLWIEMSSTVDALLLFKQAMEEGISIAPGPIFSASNYFKHCIRLNYSHTWNERADKSMQRLGQLIASMELAN